MLSTLGQPFLYWMIVVEERRLAARKALQSVRILRMGGDQMCDLICLHEQEIGWWSLLQLSARSHLLDVNLFLWVPPCEQPLFQLCATQSEAPLVHPLLGDDGNFRSFNGGCALVAGGGEIGMLK